MVGSRTVLEHTVVIFNASFIKYIKNITAYILFTITSE